MSHPRSTADRRLCWRSLADGLEIPTAIVVGAIQLVGGKVGKMAAAAYAQEGRRHVVKLQPDEEHQHFLYAAHRWEIWSERGTRDYDNRNYITPQFGHYEWTLRKKGLFQGRSWYKADFVWVSHDPAIVPDALEANRIADATLEVMRSQRQKSNAIIPPFEPPMPRGPIYRKELPSS